MPACPSKRGWVPRIRSVPSRMRRLRSREAAPRAPAPRAPAPRALGHRERRPAGVRESASEPVPGEALPKGLKQRDAGPFFRIQIGFPEMAKKPRLLGRVELPCRQAAKAGRLTAGSSLNGAMDASNLLKPRWRRRRCGASARPPIRSSATPSRRTAPWSAASRADGKMAFEITEATLPALPKPDEGGGERTLVSTFNESRYVAIRISIRFTRRSVVAPRPTILCDRIPAMPYFDRRRALARTFWR